MRVNYDGKPMTLPPVFAASALYDSLLQAALRQFFDRATFETVATPSLSSDGRLAIEPTGDPSALAVRWFGTRHVLNVPASRPFTAHEVRFARAIGAVLTARYRAIFDPKQMLERGDLFRGAIEDRYVAAFLDERAYSPSQSVGQNRADLVAGVIEVLRVAALSSYENRSISSGVLIVDSEMDPLSAEASPDAQAYRYSLTLTAVKSFYRVCDGVQTMFLVNRNGYVLDIVDLDQWRRSRQRCRELEVTCPAPYTAHALATAGNRNICVVLSPNHEIKVFAEGVEMFTFSNARWHLLDLKAKYDLWPPQSGIRRWPSDCSRQRWIWLTQAGSAVRDAARRRSLAADPRGAAGSAGFACCRHLTRKACRQIARSSCTCCADAPPCSIPPPVLSGLARIDGATVMDIIADECWRSAPLIASVLARRTRSVRHRMAWTAARPVASRITNIPMPTRIRASSGMRRPSRNTSRIPRPKSRARKWFSPASRTIRRSTTFGPTSNNSMPTAISKSNLAPRPTLCRRGGPVQSQDCESD